MLGFIEIGDEINGLSIDIRQQLFADARQPRLGVTHGRGRVAIDRAEVALPIDQRITHAKRLSHAH